MDKEKFKDMIWIKGKKYEYTDNFINFIKEEIGKGGTINSISKKVGVTYRVIKNIVNENNIIVTTHKNNSSYKAIYQDYNWCYQKYIIEGLKHEEMAMEAETTKRTIEKWCCEKHRLTQKYRQKNKQLNNIQRSLIIGSLMGDGHINKRETQALFIVCHAVNQKDYLFWKYEILKDLCNIPPVYYETSERIFDDKTYNCQPFYRLSTRIHDCLIPIREMSIYQLLDNFDELAFCIAMLDDGSRGNLWSYCVAPYTEKEKQYIIKTFKYKFNVNGYIRESDNRYLIFNAIDSKKIDDIILRNIPNNLDIIQYKIINNNKIKELSNYRMVKMKDGTECGLARFCKIYHIGNEKDNKKYIFLCNLFDNGITDEENLILNYKEEFDNE